MCKSKITIKEQTSNVENENYDKKHTKAVIAEM